MVKGGERVDRGFPMAQQVQNPPVMHVTRATVQRVAKSRSRLSNWACTSARVGRRWERLEHIQKGDKDGKSGGKGVCTS